MSIRRDRMGNELEPVQKEKPKPVQNKLEKYFMQVETSTNSIEDKIGVIYNDLQDALKRIDEIMIELGKMRDVHG